MRNLLRRYHIEANKIRRRIGLHLSTHVKHQSGVENPRRSRSLLYLCDSALRVSSCRATTSLFVRLPPRHHRFLGETSCMLNSSRHALLKSRKGSSTSLFGSYATISRSDLFGPWYVSTILFMTLSASSMTTCDDKTRIRLTRA